MSSLGKFMAGVGEESGLQSLLYVRPQACHCFAPCRNSCLALVLHLLHGTQVSTTRRQRSSIHSGHCDWFPEWIYLCFSFAVENHISTANPHFHSKLRPSNSLMMEPDPISHLHKTNRSIWMKKLGKVANYYGNSAQQSLVMLPLPEHSKYPGQGEVGRNVQQSTGLGDDLQPWFLPPIFFSGFPVDFRLIIFVQFWEPHRGRNA